MNNLKKFFAFSIATAMVAGAVWGITPTIRSLAASYSEGEYWWLKGSTYVDAYVETPPSGEPLFTEDQIKGTTGGESGNSGKTPGESGEGENSGNTPSAVESVEIIGSKYVYLGHPTQLSAYVSYSGDKENDNKVTWVCQDSEIATVNQNGLVTPIKLGQTEIIARSISNSSKYKSFPITVVPERVELSFKDVDPEKGLTIKVGNSIELAVEGAEKYSSENYKYYWKEKVLSDSDESQEEIATVTKDGKITGKAEGQGYVYLEIVSYENSVPLPVAYALCKLEVVAADTKETTTEVASSTPTNADPRGITSHDDVVVTPAVVANYQKWLSTFGGGIAEGTETVSGTAGQPGSEVVVADPKTGQTLHMFQSTDNSNTLLAAPESIVPSGTKITTLEAAADTPAFKAVQNKIARVSRRGSVQKVYGIAATAADGTLITTLNGKAAMSVPIPADINVPAGRTLVVYFIPNEGEITKLETVIDQGRVVFGTPGFGTFAFVVE